MEFSAVQKMVYDIAESKGFHEGDFNLGERLMLVVSELGEAIEADRHGRRVKAGSQEAIEELCKDMVPEAFEAHVKDTVEDEIADAVIRLMDLAGEMGLDLYTHVLLKSAYNSSRPYRHGKAY